MNKYSSSPIDLEDLFANVCAPLTSAAVSLDLDQRLRRQNHSRMNISLRYLDASIRVTAVGDGPNTVVNTEIDAGILPYSVETIEGRINALAIIFAARGLFHHAWVANDQRMCIGDQQVITGPLSPALLIGVITRFVVSVWPYVDLLLLVTHRAGVGVLAKPGEAARSSLLN